MYIWTTFLIAIQRCTASTSTPQALTETTISQSANRGRMPCLRTQLLSHFIDQPV